MKKLMIALTLLVSSSAFASSVIAQKEFWAGFSPNPVNSKISIMDDGTSVAEIRYVMENKVEFHDLATLSPAALKSLKLRIADVTPEVLKDWEEDQPKCLDAPSKSYKMVKADGTELQFYRWASCHEWVLPNADNLWKAEPIKTLLDGLEALIEYRWEIQ
ncbi:MAG: hypothetical protein H6624_19460 [Bdellovibrionaceae bacterium]|nr:hypothetical protein [Bdellovibrionales bacterium]MCB9086528.1 hypothetical protein [Pseudobdellovibrionaceae bacterium]